MLRVVVVVVVVVVCVCMCVCVCVCVEMPLNLMYLLLAAVASNCVHLLCLPMVVTKSSSGHTHFQPHTTVVC